MWPTIKRNLKGCQSYLDPDASCPNSLKLTIHEQPATIYQCLKADNMVVDYIGAGNDLNCGPKGAQALYEVVKRKLTTSTSACDANFAAPPTPACAPQAVVKCKAVEDALPAQGAKRPRHPNRLKDPMNFILFVLASAGPI